MAAGTGFPYVLYDLLKVSGDSVRDDDVLLFLGIVGGRCSWCACSTHTIIVLAVSCCFVLVHGDCFCQACRLDA